MSTKHSASIGHNPIGIPAESLSTRIKAEHHGRAANLGEELIRSFPWPNTLGELEAGESERCTFQVPPFCAGFQIYLTTSANTGTLSTRYYGAGGNVDHVRGWLQTNGDPPDQVVYSRFFDLDPVTTSAPSTVLVRLISSVDMTYWNLSVHTLHY